MPTRGVPGAGRRANLGHDGAWIGNLLKIAFLKNQKQAQKKESATSALRNGQQQASCAQYGCGGSTPQAFGAPGINSSSAPTLAGTISLAVQIGLFALTDGASAAAEALETSAASLTSEIPEIATTI